jgi:hypothetical protein
VIGMTIRRIIALTMLLGTPALAGCGNGLASVSGTITLDGKPVQGGPQMDASVSFIREDGRGAASAGTIDESGHYRLMTGAQAGVEPGSYLVGVAAKQIIPPAKPDGMPQAKLITPRKYAIVTESGFRADVKPGSNTLDFALSSAK